MTEKGRPMGWERAVYTRAAARASGAVRSITRLKPPGPGANGEGPYGRRGHGAVSLEQGQALDAAAHGRPRRTVGRGAGNA